MLYILLPYFFGLFATGLFGFMIITLNEMKPPFDDGYANFAFWFWAWLFYPVLLVFGGIGLVCVIVAGTYKLIMKVVDNQEKIISESQKALDDVNRKVDKFLGD